MTGMQRTGGAVRPRTAVPDAYGERDLWIGPCRGDNPSPGHVEIYASQVWCGDRVTLISAMHEAAGLPAPLILERKFRSLFGKCYFGPDFFIKCEGADIIAVIGAEEVTVTDPRGLAAYLALAADQHDHAAEEAEVEKLTAAIRTAPGMEGLATADVIARHILMAYRLEAKQ